MRIYGRYNTPSIIGAISCTTIYYLIQKESAPKKALSYTRNLFELLSVVEVTKKTLERGFALEAKDFEDSVQIACAQACHANYIITRNSTDYKNSPIPAISPAEYLATITT